MDADEMLGTEVEHGSTVDRPDSRPPGHADRPSRGLVLAFLLSLAFLGWLGVAGIGEVADAHHGLFAPDPNACGGP